MDSRDPTAYDRTRHAGAAPSGPSALRIGRYAVVREIARGGMGAVYEAEDPQLKRRVALKIVREDEADPDLIARLHREASIAAQLQHPNIVPVHEVGTVEDESGRRVHYISMNLVEGRTLAQVVASGSATRDDLLRMLEEVARAVSFAHGRGVIHRDLKPQNVLVDAAGRVLLTDFGLAKGASFRTQLTQSQSVMGTPHYMAPEQVEGRASDIGPRTDVYALGVMLYEILTGRVPFSAAVPAHLFRQILEDEPARPTMITQRLHADLEVICLKALGKDPAVRYATAEEFADDLARYRRQEPIQARPPSPLYRMRKRLARARGIVVASAIGALAVAVVATVLVAGWRDAEGRALEQLRKRLAVPMDAALELRRAGAGPDQMGRFVREVEEACREAAAAFPDRPEPHAHMGRMYRALMRDDEAFGEQERALLKQPGYGPALYERIVLTCRRWRRRIDGLLVERWGDTAHVIVRRRGMDRTALSRSDAEAAVLRARLEQDLKRLAAGADLRPGERDAARGMLAWMEGEPERARPLLRSALASAPALEEAHETLATLELDAKAFAEAVEQWARAVESDRGYLPHLEGRAFARAMWAWETLQGGGDPSDLAKASLQDYDEVLRRAPDRRETRLWRGLVRHAWSSSARRPPDAAEVRKAALEDFAEVARQDPADYRGSMYRGTALAVEAMERWQLHGEDPSTLCAEALAEIDRALERNPKRDDAWLYRGVTQGAHAAYRVSRMLDATDLVRRGLQDLDRALALNAERVESWMWRGTARIYLALAADPRGPDARKLYDAAMADFQRAIDLEPEHPDAWMWRGAAHGYWAAAQALRLQDPEPSLDAAFADLSRAIQVNPAHPVSRRFRGESYEARAMYRQLQKRETAPDARAALEDYAEAIRLAPHLEETLKPHVARCSRLAEWKPPK